MLQQFIEEIPQLQVAKEIGALVLKALMRPIRRFLPLEWPVARVLHAQCGSDDEHFAQAVLVLRGQYHACNFGIDRKLRQPPAYAGQGVTIIHRTQFRQQLVTVRDHAWKRGFQKREILHLADLERLHAQNHGGER